MKILIISNLYKPFNRGGAERIAEIMHKELLTQGHDVSVLSSSPYFSKVQSDNIYWPGLYYNLNKLPLFIRLFWHFFDTINIFNYFKLNSLLKNKKFDLVITHNLKGLGYLLPRAIRSHKIKHFHVLHDVQLIYPSGLIYWGNEKVVDSLLAKIYQMICNKLFMSPDLIISPSIWLSDFHKKHGFFTHSKFKILPNPVDTNDLDFIKDNHDVFTFVYAGQIEKHKGVELLIQSFLELNNLKLRLKIIGSGSQLSELKTKYSSTNITYTGKLDHKNMCKEIYNSDCLVMPSLCYENSPTVICDAASQGVISISANIGGAGEIINILGGYLFKPGDKNDLILVMNKIFNLKNETSIQGSLAKEKLKLLSSENYFKQLLELL